MGGFLIRKFGGQKAPGFYSQSAEKKKKCQLRILFPPKLSFKSEGEIKTFPCTQTRRELITIRLALKEMLKGVPQGGMKDGHVVREIPTGPSQPIQRKA